MSDLTILERVRAAVAEAGHDPSLILMSPDPDRPRTFGWYAGTLPDEIVWRAREAVEHGTPRCRRCWARRTMDGGIARRAIGCLADRRFVEDCGRDRSEP